MTVLSLSPVPFPAAGTLAPAVPAAVFAAMFAIGLTAGLAHCGADAPVPALLPQRPALPAVPAPAAPRAAAARPRMRR
ncbi:MAG: hypothetical protein F4X42_16440 [Rhodospirillaceae bacterium]|nr:hypothetical protein [Rhodospirillaceae bacterium]MYB14829.1 hypothetical protein [Rhodospirillaceae bacterium]